MTFDIDANGILNVTATDKGTGKEQKITISGGSGLSEDEIQDMIRNAESNATEAKRLKEIAEARNHAETLAYSTEKALKEHGDKVSSEVVTDIEAAIKDLRELADTSENVDAIKARTEHLAQVAQELGKAMYESQEADAGEAAADSAESGDADVEVEDVEIIDEEQPTKA